MNARRILLLALLSTVLSACGGGGGGSGGNTNPGTPVVTSKFSGAVRDLGGAPVAGATISLFHHNDNTTLTTTTDASGAWTLAGVPTGNYTDYAVYVAKDGLGFYPAPSDPAGATARFDFNGLYRTVVRFLTVPARDVAGINFTALHAGDRLASLARTGQASSYAAGDDFAAARGVAWPAQRFVDNLDGSVSDRLTGLVWLKNAGCFLPTDWTSALAAANTLASGACGLSDGSHAGQWRMPNINELESLVDIAHSNPALPAAHPFTRVNLASAYWSSTTYTAGPANAMAIRFGDGRWINGVDSADGSFANTKSSAANGLWAVRTGTAGAVQLLATGAYAGQGGGSYGAGDDAALQLGVPLSSARFIDKGDGTVADTVTGLTWLKQADCIHQDWAGALVTINTLASGRCGLSDGSQAGQWRMPNRAEMLSLSDRAPTFPQASYLNGQYQNNSSVNGPVIFGQFIVSDYYWTSSTDAADPTQAWTIYSCDFGVYNIPKSALRFALAVR